MNRVFIEIEKFRKWAEAYSHIAQDERGGEWETDYPDWPIIWSEFELFLKENHFSTWSEEQQDNVLYIIARDNECNSVIELIAEHPETLEFIAEKGLNFNSNDTKWQIAEMLHKLPNKARAEQLLEHYLKQHIEYVSRMAIQSLGRLKSGLTEKYCQQAWGWNQDDPMSQYQRIMALTVLFEYKSPLLEKYIALAKEDGRKYLVNQAVTIEAEMKADKAL